MRGVLLQNLVVVWRNGVLLHDGGHHLGRALGIHLAPVGFAVLADDAHPLQVGVELESPKDYPAVAALTLKAEDNPGIGVGLVEREPAEEEGLHLHGVADQLIGLFNFNDRVIGGHIGEYAVDEGVLRGALEHLVDTGLVVGHGRVEFPGVSWNQRVKIHIILSEGAGLIETAKLYHAAHDDLVLRNTENLLLLQSLHRVDYAKGHRDRQGRRDRNCDQIEELLNEILGLNVGVDEDDEDDERSHRQTEQEKQVLV